MDPAGGGAESEKAILGASVDDHPEARHDQEHARDPCDQDESPNIPRRWDWHRPLATA
jgi:hypothetical protein